MLFAVVASSMLVQGNIDYETKAKSLDKILQDLSTQTGKVLVANPPMNREIVVLPPLCVSECGKAKPFGSAISPRTF